MVIACGGSPSFPSRESIVWCISGISRTPYFLLHHFCFLIPELLSHLLFNSLSYSGRNLRSVFLPKNSLTRPATTIKGHMVFLTYKPSADILVSSTADMLLTCILFKQGLVYFWPCPFNLNSSAWWSHMILRSLLKAYTGCWLSQVNEDPCAETFGLGLKTVVMGLVIRRVHRWRPSKS